TDGSNLDGAHQFHQLTHLLQAANVAALDNAGIHRDKRQRHIQCATIKSNDNDFSALAQATQSKIDRGFSTYKIDNRVGTAIAEQFDGLDRSLVTGIKNFFGT